MEKIGVGWQYTVYELGNGRVFKKFNNPVRRLFVILNSTFPFDRDPFWKIPSYINAMPRRAEQSIKTLKNGGFDLGLFANPEFKEGLSYEQDKVIPLEDYLRESKYADGQNAIDKFIEFNKKLVKLGIIDKSFNIGKNFGIDKQENIVLFDIGELFEGGESVKKQIAKRPWNYPYVIKSIPQSFVHYFTDGMDRAFYG